MGVLLYVIDIARSEDPFGEFVALQQEVAHFSWEMAAKPSGIIANKCDLARDVSLRRADELYPVVARSSHNLGMHTPIFVRALSARYAEGILGLLQELRRILQGEHEGVRARAAALESAAARETAVLTEPMRLSTTAS